MPLFKTKSIWVIQPGRLHSKLPLQICSRPFCLSFTKTTGLALLGKKSQCRFQLQFLQKLASGESFSQCHVSQGTPACSLWNFCALQKGSQRMSESNIAGLIQTRCWEIHQQISSMLSAGKRTAPQVVVSCDSDGRCSGRRRVESFSPAQFFEPQVLPSVFNVSNKGKHRCSSILLAKLSQQNTESSRSCKVRFKPLPIASILSIQIRAQKLLF